MNNDNEKVVKGVGDKKFLYGKAHQTIWNKNFCMV